MVGIYAGTAACGGIIAIVVIASYILFHGFTGGLHGNCDQCDPARRDRRRPRSCFGNKARVAIGCRSAGPGGGAGGREAAHPVEEPMPSRPALDDNAAPRLMTALARRVCAGRGAAAAFRQRGIASSEDTRPPPRLAASSSGRKRHHVLFPKQLLSERSDLYSLTIVSRLLYDGHY